MRIVTWNANAHARIMLPASAQAAFARAQEAVNGFKPDITVFQEIPNPFTPNSSTQFWHGPITARGVAVCVQPPFMLTPCFSTLPQSVFPFRVEGPVSFTLLAVWSLPPERSPSLQAYVREVIAGIVQCREFLRSGPAVIVGDFNSSGPEDAPAKAFTHGALVHMLRDEFNLISAYHQAHNVAHGGKVDPTFYLYRKKERSYHIDYCFVPMTWQINSVEVGSFEAWSTRSDHCPLCVDVVPC